MFPVPYFATIKQTNFLFIEIRELLATAVQMGKQFSNNTCGFPYEKALTLNNYVFHRV